MTSQSEPPAPPQIYANLSQVAASPSDVQITLGLSGTAPLGDTQNAPSTPVAVIRLSPPAAKMLMQNLEQMVALYEARFSKIYVPKEFADAIREGSAQLGLPEPDRTP